MATKYEEVKELKLTVSQMLSLLLALSDARNHNEEHNFPGLAREVDELREVVRKQCDEWIEAADAEIQAENAKLREEQLEAENMEKAEFK